MKSCVKLQLTVCFKAYKHGQLNFSSLLTRSLSRSQSPDYTHLNFILDAMGQYLIF